MMTMKKIILLLLLAFPFLSYGQSSCSLGQAASTVINTPVQCVSFLSNFGTTVNQTGLTGAMSTQTICDTSSTCPAGFYTLFAYVSISNTGTLASAVTSNLT